jgi:hypothetical protein
MRQLEERNRQQAKDLEEWSRRQAQEREEAARKAQDEARESNCVKTPSARTRRFTRRKP